MNAHSFAVTHGVASLKQMAEVLKMTQKRLNELYKSDPPAFEALCEAAHHRLQERIILDSMLRHRQAIAV